MEGTLDSFNLDLLSKIKDIESFPYKRFLFYDLIKNLDNDLIIFVKGLRGVGKTTLLLQLADYLIKDGKRVMYFSADHIAFSKFRVYEFVKYLSEHEYNFVFIDEIHLYNNAAQELKNIYDDLKIKVIVTGSNSLKILKTKYDLSRRAILKELPVLSYREFLIIKQNAPPEKLELSNILSEYKKLPLSKKYVLLDLYWTKGAYPFFWKYTDSEYLDVIKGILDKMIFEDLLTYGFSSETLLKGKKILLYLAQNPPSEINPNSISGATELSRDTVLNILEAFKDMGLVKEISSNEKGKNILTGNKKYLLVPPFRYILCKLALIEPHLGALREDFFINHTAHLNPKYFSDVKSPDYIIGKDIFEIGGKSKNKKQIYDKKQAHLVLDVSFSYDYIPLYLFGFLY